MGSKWAANRFKGPYLRNTLWELGYSADTIETAVDWPQVKPLMLAMEQAARDVSRPMATPVHAFTHLSHLYPQGSSIYSQYVWPTAPGGFAPNFERWQKLKAAVAAHHCRARRHREPPARRGARPCGAPGTVKKARWAWPRWPGCAATLTRTAS
jgi:hypothetical protein